MKRAPSITSLDQQDFPQIKSLLTTHSLPIDDLETASIRFYGIKSNDQLLAVGAIEQYGSNALLRSLAVVPSNQNTGLGQSLVKHLEMEAKKQNIQRLYLLTTTANSYFNKLGYHQTTRESFPEALQASAEFSSLCPSTASCFFKEL